MSIYIYVCLPWLKKKNTLRIRWKYLYFIVTIMFPKSDSWHHHVHERCPMNRLVHPAAFSNCSSRPGMPMKNMCWGHSPHEKFHIHMLGMIDFPMKCHSLHVFNWFNCRIPTNLDTSPRYVGKCGWEGCRGPPGSPPRSHRFSPQQTMGEIQKNLRHKNCQNVNVELAIKIYVQCKKKK